MSPQTSIAPPLAPRPWSDRVANAALYLLCLTAFAAPAGAEVATVLLTLAFLSAAPRARLLLREPVVLLALAGAGYGLVHTLFSSLLLPQHTGLYWDGLADWLKLLLFIPVAFFSRGDERKLDILLLLLLCGLVLRVLIRMDWTTLIADPGQVLALRPGFGLPALAFAFYGGAGLIGLATVGRRLLCPRPGAAGRDPLLVTFCILAAGVLFLGLSLTAARSGWLALLAALPVALWVSRRRWSPTLPQVRGSPWLKAAGALAVATLVGLGSHPAFERAAWELDALATSPAGGEQTALTSDRLRLNGLRFGVETWLQRPLVGWGANAGRHLLESGAPDDLRSSDEARLEHLHNTYLEILVQFGALGLVLVAIFLLVFARGLRLSCRSGQMSRLYCGLFAGILVLALVWSLFEYRLLHRDWRVFWMILAGLAYGFLLKQLPTAARRDPTPSEVALARRSKPSETSRKRVQTGSLGWYGLREAGRD